MAKVNSRDIYHKKYVLVYWYTRDHYDNSLSFYMYIAAFSTLEFVMGGSHC